MKEKVSRSRSWFCRYSNPKNPKDENFKLFKDLNEKEICDKVLDVFIGDNNNRSGACSYCISGDKKLHHLHIVLEDKNKVSFSTIKKMFPGIHIEETLGNSKQALDYILSQNDYAEKDEQVIDYSVRGEIVGKQGSRTDIKDIKNLIDLGYSPNEILDMNSKFWKFEKEIRSAYFRKRLNDTPRYRDVEVIVHCGATGSGKSFSQLDTPLEELFKITDYKNPFDDYSGERVVFIDEFRGQISYSNMLLATDKYVSKLPARYHSIYSLWDKIEISSIIPPEDWYDNQNIRDTQEQLYRRITKIVYHYKTPAGKYESYEIPFSKYTSYNDLLLEVSKKYVKKYKIKNVDVVLGAWSNNEFNLDEWKDMDKELLKDIVKKEKALKK